MQLGRRHFVSILLGSMILAGCGSSTSDNYHASQAPGGYVLFNNETGDIPYPNDILMNSKTGRVNLPTQPGDKDYAVKSALNTLDGFSTTAPISVGISAEVNASTLPAHVMLIDTTAGAMRYGRDFVAAQSGEKLAIVPLHPLKGDHRYIVALTRGITAKNGKPIEPDYVTTLLLSDQPLVDREGHSTIDKLTDEEAQQLEMIRQHTRQLIAATGIPAAGLLDIWSFKTQTIGKVAKAFADAGNARSAMQFGDTHYTSKQILAAAGYDTSAMQGSAEVYKGVLLNIPYYLGIPSTQDPTAPLHKSFTFEGNATLPTPTATISIPALAVVPNAASGCSEPSAGWPVVIYQHGITRNRTDLLAVSEVFTNKDRSGQCYAAVAIDLPLHGVTDPTNPLYQESNATLHLSERTFNVDYVTQDSDGSIIAAQPDGKIDASGTHYINLRSLLTSRDNVRQTTSDLTALVAALGRTQGIQFDTSKIYYVGHSLGAMAPFGYLANKTFKTVVLANTGGGIAQLLNHSETFGPVIQQGLANEGIQPGTPEYAAFMNATQTVIDDADPINYAQAVATSGNKILSFEVKNDAVIPNAVATAPLSGTDPVLRLMSAQDINTSAAPGLVPVGQITKTFFTEGGHSSFLTPQVSPTVTIEMWGETRSFITTEGTKVLIQYPDVIAPH